MRRYDRARRLAALDPVADRVEIAGALLQYEFCWDMMRSLELALFRTYAVPSIGRLLDRTGEFTDRTQRRYDDTVMILFRMWLGGPKADGRPAVEQLNNIHGRYRISNDDYRYTLATFVVVPIRWLRRFGWRAPSEVEVQAWTNVMLDMGELMGITEMPQNFAAFERLLDSYEAEHFGYDEGGARVAQSTMELMVSWYPRPVRPALRAAIPAVLDDPVLQALQLPSAGPRARRLASAVLWLRGRVVRYLPARPDSRPFVPHTPTRPVSTSTQDLGPKPLLRRVI